MSGREDLQADARRRQGLVFALASVVMTDRWSDRWPMALAQLAASRALAAGLTERDDMTLILLADAVIVSAGPDLRRDPDFDQLGNARRHARDRLAELFALRAHAAELALGEPPMQAAR